VAKRKKTAEAAEPLTNAADPVRFCALEDIAEARDTKWGKKRLAWFVASDLPSVLHDALRGTVKLALGNWALVCDLTFTEAAGAESADILVTTGTIDGPSGVLAWSELPPSSPCHQRYDTGENWTTDAHGQQGPIDLLAVITHETGHALGLQHAPQGTPDLMAPFYSPTIRTPQPGDIARMQALYGKPTVNPPDVPAPPLPGGGSRITLEITNADLIRIIDANGHVAKVTWPA
jgi:hypothetical protein